MIWWFGEWDRFEYVPLAPFGRRGYEVPLIKKSLKFDPPPSAGKILIIGQLQAAPNFRHKNKQK